MYFLPKDEMNINKFVHSELPSKRQIFYRTGQRSVSPAGSYTGEDSVVIGATPTEQADRFAKNAESFDLPE